MKKQVTPGEEMTSRFLLIANKFYAFFSKNGNKIVHKAYYRKESNVV